VFIAVDTDTDGALDPGEKLVALKTSKIYATMTAGAVERRRGADLIQNEADVTATTAAAGTSRRGSTSAS